MEINQRNPNELKPYRYNSRKHSDEQIERIANSLKEFGWTNPVLIDSQDVIVAGHARVMAALKLGMEEVPTVSLVNLTPAQIRAYVVADNRLAELSEWDMDILKSELEEIKFDFDLSLVGWEGFKFEEEKAEEDDFQITECEIETDIVLGDLIEIGSHRLLCGDSTCSDTVAKLMDGKKADMVFTDPPYDLKNENYHSNIFLFTENAHVFVMHDDRGIVNYLRKSKLDFLRFFIADFNFCSPRGNDPYLRHILISHEKNGKAIAHKNMRDGLSSILKLEYRFRLKDEKTNHKHQKPINFISKFIEHYSNEESIILDIFLGSGSAMVASHKLKRKCYGMELDPKYCQVIVDRMIKSFPDLTVKINGVIYNQNQNEEK